MHIFLDFLVFLAFPEKSVWYVWNPLKHNEIDTPPMQNHWFLTLKRLATLTEGGGGRGGPGVGPGASELSAWSRAASLCLFFSDFFLCVFSERVRQVSFKVFVGFLGSPWGHFWKYF